VNSLIASTSAQVVGAVRGQIAAADARLAALDQLKAQSAGTMSTLPTTEAEESGLLAQVENYRKEAERLREELQKAQIEEAAQAGQIEVVDLATLPRVPIGTGRTPRVVLALILGLAIGSLIAYVLENYSAVIRRREDVERASGATILSIVPPFSHVGGGKGVKLLPWKKDGDGNGTQPPQEHPDELVTMVDIRSQAAEAYRTLRTNLLFSTEVRSLRQLMVTSSGPSEGKSTTAANLAVAFAQQGKRVLLVDCDLRRPRLHKMFHLPQIPGLTNALMGGASHAEVTLPTGVENLSVMVSGPTPPNPVELLGSDRMTTLLERLSESYDLVVLDTPPVLVASDAAILSRQVDGTIFVVRAGTTQSAALRDGIERLGAVGTHVMGTVINDPEGELAKFASYYGYEYDGYYEASPV
jgi:capsular exopolysaccharide synthesis family protein